MSSSDFEWVDARAACSAAKLFQQLKGQVTHDVELRNKMSEGRGYKFDTHFESLSITVFLDSNVFSRNIPQRVVRFYLDGSQIIARYGDDTDIFVASATLNEDRECRLRIKDKNYASSSLSPRPAKPFFSLLRN